ncbi:DUF1642 domain-containing protein [Streptococcus sp. 10F2]
MTEKLKYKVGDKVMIEAKIEEADSYDTYPYRLRIGNAITGWVKSDEFKKSLVNLPPKPKIPQAVMEYYEKHKDSDWTISDYLRHHPEELEYWFFYDDNKLKNQHALATLITYGPEAVEVEKEKRYRVVFKSSGQVLAKVNDHSIDEVYFMFLHKGDMCYPKQELIEAGFEGVFANEMFEVEEVEQ